MSASKDSSVSAHAFVESASDPTMVIWHLPHGSRSRDPDTGADGAVVVPHRAEAR